MTTSTGTTRGSTSTEVPRLSPSIAKRLLDESPLSAWAAHRLLGNQWSPPAPSSSQLEGRLWHAAILGGHEEVAVLDYDAFRSNEAKADRDAALAKRLIPVTKSKWEEKYAPGGEALRKMLADRGVSLGGAVEHRVEWAQDGTLCSGVLDHWDGGCGIDEIKTMPGHPTTHACQQVLTRTHALLQDAAYRRAISEATGEAEERISVRFVFVQTQEPYGINIAPLSGAAREVSMVRWRRALALWQECLDRGRERADWPGPNDGETPFDVPEWMLKRELEIEAMED